MIHESGSRASLQRRRFSNGQLAIGAFPHTSQTSLSTFRRGSLSSAAHILHFEDTDAAEIGRQTSRAHTPQASTIADRSPHSMILSLNSRSVPGERSSNSDQEAEQSFADFRREETDAWRNAFALRSRNTINREAAPDADYMVSATPCCWTKVSEVKLTGVREDYYSTLLCSFSSWVPDPWTKVSLKYADLEARKLIAKVNQDSVFSLNHHMLQQWSNQLGHERFPDPASDRKKLPSYDRPTGLAVSKLGFIIVAYQSGKIVVRDLLDPNNFGVVMLCEAVKLFNNGLGSPELPKAAADDSLNNQLRQFNYVTHVIWCQLTPAEPEGLSVSRMGHKVEGFLGDQSGCVYKFAVERIPDQEHLVIRVISTVPSEKFHKDSICSMVLDCNEQRLAVSGTDNVVRVWRHNCSASDPQEVLIHLNDLPQFSAVRSVCFSPIKSDLLLTGGGRHDRTFRVFNTGQTQAVFQIAMPAQIVGIVWLNQLEVFVAFGHSRLNKYRGYGKVVNILTGQIIAELPGRGYLLTALKTQSGFCVHTNQSSLISYTWDSRVQRITSSELEDAYMFATRSPQLR